MFPGQIRATGRVLAALLGICLSQYLPLTDVFPQDLPASISALAHSSGVPVMSLGAAGVCVTVLLFALRLSRRESALAAQARSAGLIPARGDVVRARAGRQTEKIMIIGATGRSFSQEEGELSAALLECREARIMLLDPREHGALARIRGIPDPEITIETIHRQIASTIEFLRGVRSAGGAVSLKLYPDMPLFKLAIMRGFATLRHYHPGLNVRHMPEFAFRDAGRHGGLYLPLCRYFESRWQDPDIPEYDFLSDELVYHDQLGAEVLREPFSSIVLPDKGGGEGEGDNRRSYIFRSDDIEDEKKGRDLIPSER